MAGLALNAADTDGVVFTVTSSPVGFRRVQSHCNGINLCKTLKPLDKHITKSLERKVPEPSSIRHQASEIEGVEEVVDVENVVCLTQPHNYATDGCRVCLREKSESKRLGEFSVAIEAKRYFVYVLRTSSDEDVVANACETNGACHYFEKDIYPDDVSQEIYNTEYEKVSKNHNDHNMDGLVTLPAGESDQKTHFVISKIPSPLLCLKTELIGSRREKSLSYHRYIVEFMETMSSHQSSYVHQLNVDVEPRDHAFLLLRSSKSPRSWSFP